MYAMHTQNLTPEDRRIFDRIGVVATAEYRNADLLSHAFTMDDLFSFGSVRAAVCAAEKEAEREPALA